MFVFVILGIAVCVSWFVIAKTNVALRHFQYVVSFRKMESGWLKRLNFAVSPPTSPVEFVALLYSTQTLMSCSFPLNSTILIYDIMPGMVTLVGCILLSP